MSCHLEAVLKDKTRRAMKRCGRGSFVAEKHVVAQGVAPADAALKSWQLASSPAHMQQTRLEVTVEHKSKMKLEYSIKLENGKCGTKQNDLVCSQA